MSTTADPPCISCDASVASDVDRWYPAAMSRVTITIDVDLAPAELATTISDVMATLHLGLVDVHGRELNVDRAMKVYREIAQAVVDALRDKTATRTT